MGNLFDVKKAVAQFLTSMIKCTDITVLKIEKVNDIWNTAAEVYEEDSILKSMGYPPKKARAFYSLKLDGNLEVISYERVSSFEGIDGAN